jgi:hypothetical protein
MGLRPTEEKLRFTLTPYRPRMRELYSLSAEIQPVARSCSVGVRRAGGFVVQPTFFPRSSPEGNEGIQGYGRRSRPPTIRLPVPGTIDPESLANVRVGVYQQCRDGDSTTSVAERQAPEV